MSLNLFSHAILAVLAVWWLAHISWTRVLKTWSPDKRWMRFAVIGLLLATTAGVGLITLYVPSSQRYFGLSAALYTWAFALGLFAVGKKVDALRSFAFCVPFTAAGIYLALQSKPLTWSTFLPATALLLLAFLFLVRWKAYQRIAESLGWQNVSNVTGPKS